MNKIDYRAIHPDASDDYKLAYDLVNELGIGCSKAVIPDNVKVFRKYIYDLSYKRGKEIATRKRDENTLNVTRLS